MNIVGLILVLVLVVFLASKCASGFESNNECNKARQAFVDSGTTLEDSMQKLDAYQRACN